MNETMMDHDPAGTEEPAPAGLAAPDAGRTPPGRKRCPNCAALLGVRTSRCGCGYAFPVKEKPAAARKAERGAAVAPASGRAPDDPLARALSVCDEIAAFCGRIGPFAAIASRIEAVDRLAGQLTPEEHAEIVRLAARAGGFGPLLLVAREISSGGSAAPAAAADDAAPEA